MISKPRDESPPVRPGLAPRTGPSRTTFLLAFSPDAFPRGQRWSGASSGSHTDGLFCGRGMQSERMEKLDVSGIHSSWR